MELNIPILEKNKILVKMISPIVGNLTSKEIDILTIILDKKISILDKNTRTDVRMSLNMGKFNFNNYIQKLKEKKIILVVDKLTLEINPTILNILKQESLSINFV